MKKSIRYIVISLIAIFFINGCSKQPLQEINAAKAAVDSIVSEGAEKYLPEDAKQLNEDLNKALDAVQAQDSKIFKNYGKAKSMLAKVKSEAEAVSAKLPAKQEEAKKNAIAAIKNAAATIDAAKELSEKTKDTKDVSETMRAEIKNLADSLDELLAQLDREDYLTIASRAEEIKGKASELSILINQTPAKTEKKKK